MQSVILQRDGYKRRTTNKCKNGESHWNSQGNHTKLYFHFTTLQSYRAFIPCGRTGKNIRCTERAVLQKRRTDSLTTATILYVRKEQPQHWHRLNRNTEGFQHFMNATTSRQQASKRHWRTMRKLGLIMTMPQTHWTTQRYTLHSTDMYSRLI